MTEGHSILLAEVDSNGSLLHKYVFGTDTISRIDQNNMVQNYLYDGFGSVVGLTDTTGQLIATYDYDECGLLKS
jgi:YD repeat-containing protein